MPETSVKALQALARIVSQGRDFTDVHPVLAKRALQELYEMAEERETDEAANALWAVDFVWSTWTREQSPEQRYVRELAAAVNCTPDQAKQHLHVLWDRQNAPSKIEQLQRRAMVLQGSDTTADGHLQAHICALRELSRTESRELLQDFNVLSQLLGGVPWQSIATAGMSDVFDMFPLILIRQCGRYAELLQDDPARRTGDYLDNLSQDQAALLAPNTRLDGRPWTNAERQAFERVLRRNPENEAYYDRMRPRDAWNELCALTGQDQPYGMSNMELDSWLAVSSLRYELSALPPSEHIEGLYRAAHLALFSPASKGLAQRLGVGPITSSKEVEQRLQDLTQVERQEFKEIMDVLRIDVDYALRLEGIEVDANRPFHHNFAPPVEPREAIPSLRDMSVRAAGRAGAWQYLTKLCNLNHLGPTITPAARSELAAALARKFPHMDDYLELLAHQLRLLPQIRAHRAAQLREQHQPAPKTRSVELEP